MKVRHYQAALPMGDPRAEARAELKANGYVLPERQPAKVSEKKEATAIEATGRIKVAAVVARGDQ